MSPKERKDGGTEEIFEEIIGKNFLTIMRTINSQIQEIQQTPTTRNMKKMTPRHNIIKLSKTGDTILRVHR